MMAAVQRTNQMRGGRFTIVRPLSKGGMGALYLASESIATGTRKVVIKEMLEYFEASDPQGREKAQRRFESEAVTLANLSIPGIPQVFDYFSEGGRNYIVMQFIEGQNLESGLSHLDDRGILIKGKPYPVEQVRQWGSEVCKMLESLAVQNIIHMDIKPANLILDKSGSVWLVDFGTAKVPRMVLPPAGGRPAMLKKSSVYGTLGYAAPEQAAGRPEARSDIYSLAATLYHLATDDDPGVQPGKFTQLDRLPPDFTAALKGALAIDVHKRSTGRQFGQALEPRNTRALGFHWQDGKVSQEPAELAADAQIRWEEALAYFSNRSWENWFQDIHRHDLVGRISQIKNQVKDPDLGLDACLRLFNPSFPPAILRLPVSTLDAGVLPWRGQRVIELELQNSGSGALQARLQNLPPGIRASPDTLSIHRRQNVKLFIDSSMLTPSAKPQTIPITIDAGIAGQVRVRLRLTIPMPQFEITPAEIDLGSIARGQAVAEQLTIRNAGSSAFRTEITSYFPGLGLNPQHLESPPGSQQTVNLIVDTRQLRVGQHLGEVSVRAQAGSWEFAQAVPLRLEISLLKTTWRGGAPILAWMAGCGAYGSFVGWFLATLVGGLGSQVSSFFVGGMAGAFLGTLICLFPALVLGALGWLGAPPGRAGLHLGASLGGISGAVSGGLIGAICGWLSVGVNVFGVLVGGISAAVLGVLLQRRVKR